MKELTFLCSSYSVNSYPRGIAAWHEKDAVRLFPAASHPYMLTQTPFYEFILILNILNFVLSITIELYFKVIIIIVIVVVVVCMCVCVVHACYWMHVDVRG